METLTTLLAIILNQVACNFAYRFRLSLICLVKEEFIQSFFFSLFIFNPNVPKVQKSGESLNLNYKGYGRPRAIFKTPPVEYYVYRFLFRVIFFY